MERLLLACVLQVLVLSYSYTVNNGQDSNSASASVIVTHVNQAPTISTITDQRTAISTATPAIAFSVGDAETTAASLTISAISSNTTLLPNANISLGGAGANRTITLTPVSNLTGQSTITVSVSDGTVSVSTTFVLTVAVDFSGLDPITVYTDHAATLTWTNAAGIVSYNIYKMTPTPITYIASVTAPTATYTLTGLTANTSYSYRMVALDIQGNIASDSIQSFTTNSGPPAPTGISLKIPTSSPGVLKYPSFTITGVRSGDTVHIYKDDCVTEYGHALASGTSVNVQASVAIEDGESFTIKTDSTNTEGYHSTCSTASVAYAVSGALSCPAGYIQIPGNATYGEPNDFCVAKYQMSCADDVAGQACVMATLPSSQASYRPWVNISQTDARSRCQALGTGFDLITNTKWMTIAVNIENQASNWTLGAVGSGSLFKGHSDGTPNNTIVPGSDDEDGYLNTGDSASSGADQRRTMQISNGNVIWDFSGNAWEWVLWNIPSDPTTIVPEGTLNQDMANVGSAWTDLKDLTPTTLMPLDSYMPSHPAYTNVQGVGRYLPGGSVGSGGAALRGNNWHDSANAGVFSLLLNLPGFFFSNDLAYRCVWTP